MPSTGNRSSLFSSMQDIGPVYAFLDLEHPAVSWAVMRGMLVSADKVSGNNGFVSFMQAGMITAKNSPRIFNETIIELWRAARFPSAASRMRGMYFFGSRAEAEARIDDPDWLPYFQLDNLIELKMYCDVVPTIVDANWITFANIEPATGLMSLHDLDWITNYWEAKEYNKDPVWEVITNDVAVVLDEAVRRRCCAYVEEKFPESQIPILMARIASEVGTKGGLVHPFLLREDNDTVSLSYLGSDAEFHDKTIIQMMAKHPDFGKLAKLMSGNETWRAPDFQPWGRKFKVTPQSLPQLGIKDIFTLHNN